MVYEPGNTSLLPKPRWIPSCPTNQTKPFRIHQDGGPGWWAWGGHCTSVSPLDAHTAEDDGKVVSPEGKLCDSVLRCSHKLKTQSPYGFSAWSGFGEGGQGLALYTDIDI